MGSLQGGVAETRAFFPDVVVVGLLATAPAVHPMAMPSKTLELQGSEALDRWENLRFENLGCNSCNPMDMGGWCDSH